MKSPEKQEFEVVVAGQVPPPIGGQNICVRRMIDVLSIQDTIRCRHLKFEFTKQWAGARKPSLFKVLEIVRVIARTLQLRFETRADCLVFPIGGPHISAIMRDLMVLPWMRVASRRVILHFHAAGLAEMLAEKHAAFRIAVKFLYRICADEAIVLTDAGCTDAQALGLKIIHILPNATDDLALSYSERRISDGKTVILNVGHLCEEKGTPQLLKAFGRLASEHGQLQLRLVGEPISPYTADRLQCDIASTGVSERIQWNGVLQGESLAKAYRDADLFVFSSVMPHESFGLVLIEAMQWSLPIVVTDWRANLSVVTPEMGGVAVESPKADLALALVKAVNLAIEKSELWPEWGRRNRAIYLERYTISAWRDGLMKILEKSPD